MVVSARCLLKAVQWASSVPDTTSLVKHTRVAPLPVTFSWVSPTGCCGSGLSVLSHQVGKSKAASLARWLAAEPRVSLGGTETCQGDMT